MNQNILFSHNYKYRPHIPIIDDQVTIQTCEGVSTSTFCGPSALAPHPSESQGGADVWGSQEDWEEERAGVFRELGETEHLEGWEEGPLKGLKEGRDKLLESSSDTVIHGQGPAKEEET